MRCNIWVPHRPGRWDAVRLRDIAPNAAKSVTRRV
nr:MAG TPA: hypothetical protein [Caudoviricetes sp.]